MGGREGERWIKTLVMEKVNQEKIQENLLRWWKYSISLWAIGYTSLSSCQNYNFDLKVFHLKLSLSWKKMYFHSKTFNCLQEPRYWQYEVKRQAPEKRPYILARKANQSKLVTIMTLTEKRKLVNWKVKNGILPNKQ